MYEVSGGDTPLPNKLAKHTCTCSIGTVLIAHKLTSIYSGTNIYLRICIIILLRNHMQMFMYAANAAYDPRVMYMYYTCTFRGLGTGLFSVLGDVLGDALALSGR